MKKERRERLYYKALFLEKVENIILRGGNCLLPVFVLGRAQELLLILERHWEANNKLQHIPILYASTLMAKCLMVFQNYVNMMGTGIKQQMSNSKNPFNFKFVNILKGIDSLNNFKETVVMASPGMLQKGLSRTIFEKWCCNESNGVIFTGYCVENTLARNILNGMRTYKQNNKTHDIKMSVDYISFSAHADFNETKGFIEKVDPNTIILVHGEKYEANRMLKEFEKIFAKDKKFYAPRNWQSIECSINKKAKAKVTSSIVKESLTKLEDIIKQRELDNNNNDNKESNDNTLEDDYLEIDIESILLKDNSQKYYFIKPEDIEKIYRVAPMVINNKIKLNYVNSIDGAFFIIKSIYKDLKYCKTDSYIGFVINEKVLVYKNNKDDGFIYVEWESGTFTDIVADCICYLLDQMPKEKEYDIINNIMDSDNFKTDISKDLNKLLEKSEFYIKDNLENNSIIEFYIKETTDSVATFDLKAKTVSSSLNIIKDRVECLLKKFKYI